IRTRSIRSSCPASKASWGSCRTTRRSSRCWASGSCGSGKAARRRRARSPAGSSRSGRTVSSSWPRRRTSQARSTWRRLRKAAVRPNARSREPRRRIPSTWPPPERSSRRHFSGSALPSADTAKVPGTAANAAQRRMADAKPFHWEYNPEPVAREVFRVEGGHALSGVVPISGAKNAALKLLAAATLNGERCRFTNVPEIEDVRVMAETLRDLGVVVDHPADNVYEVASGDVEWLFVALEAAAKMRASFMPLGPLLSRFGRVIIRNPGGDRIGRRPVDLHVEAMRTLGADIEYRNGYYFATAPGRLRGTEIRFPFVSVMGTENAMLAATLAEGHTVIRPAAAEPEVDDLIAFLQKMGAEVER